MVRAVVLLSMGVSPWHGYDIYKSLREHPCVAEHQLRLPDAAGDGGRRGWSSPSGKMPPTTIRRGGSTS